jgi:hypothetical protein
VGASVAGASVSGASVGTGAGVVGAAQAARISEATIITTVTRYSFFIYFFSSLKMETWV